jgi:hypothetical protein
LAFVDDKDSDRRRKNIEDQETASGAQAPKKRAPAADVGRALRSAYDEAVSEDIPPEMLDLLGKLG